MNFASFNDVRDGGFVGFVAISALQTSGVREVPDEPGIYLVLRPDAGRPDFLPKGTGGYFKGEDPNVEVRCLRSKWVVGTVVLYVGKAGGPGRSATLKSRLKTYMRFGQRKKAGHWGGRYIWQLSKSRDLLVCWKATGKAVPRDVERGLIWEFEQKYGNAPFANIKR